MSGDPEATCDPRSISPELAAALGRETLAIIARGHYTASDDRQVDIAALVARAVAGTRDYPHDDPVPLTDRKANDRRTPPPCVRNQPSLTAARELCETGVTPVVLNFASALHPGGGFLHGARAQEESLVRASGLFPCIHESPMYAYHERQRDAMYSDYAIYSPDVPVFRRENGTLLDEPFCCTFITCAAPNVYAMPDRDERRKEINAALTRRVDRVLRIAATHGHDTLVLGAWGCGAFGNDPSAVAGMFHDALTGDFSGRFSTTVFAILDSSPSRQFIGPFEMRFSSSPDHDPDVRSGNG